MIVEFFNVPYFFFVLFPIAFIIASYFIFRKKSLKAKQWFIGILLFANLALHFLKLLFPPYSTDPDKAMRDVWFINICAVSVLTFPFIFISKNKGFKDFMFYLGAISGTLAMVIPTEALGKELFQFDVIRFYICHIIILVAPILMVALNVHRPDWKRIWKMPFYAAGVLLFIVAQQVIQSEMGIVALRTSDFFNPNYKNPSLIWGPGDESLAKIFTIFTPEFMTVVPYGTYAGQTKYWPFFYLMPGITVYFLVLPFLICLPLEAKHMAADFKKFGAWVKFKFSKKTEK